MPQDLNLDDVRAMAMRAGLTRVTEEHLQQLLRATQNARRLAR